jgi:FeS assembly SUF system protein
MENPQLLEEKVIETLKTIFDPEIPVNIYELGLIYKVRIEQPDEVYIKMTLTSPQCPVAESLPIDVESKVSALEDVSRAYVEIVWEPTWNPEMMSEAAKLELGFL